MIVLWHILFKALSKTFIITAIKVKIGILLDIWLEKTNKSAIITAIKVKIMGKIKEELLNGMNGSGNPVPGIGPAGLAEAIHFHRKKSGLTQKELAKLAGVGKTVIYDIEKGKGTIRLNTLLKILNVLNIEMLFQGPIMETFLRSKNK